MNNVHKSKMINRHSGLAETFYVVMQLQLERPETLSIYLTIYQVYAFACILEIQPGFCLLHCGTSY